MAHVFSGVEKLEYSAWGNRLGLVTPCRVEHRVTWFAKDVNIHTDRVGTPPDEPGRHGIGERDEGHALC